MKKMLAISAILLLSAVAANAQSGMSQPSINWNVAAFLNNYSATQSAIAGSTSTTASNDSATDKSDKDSRVTEEAGKSSVSRNAQDSGFILPVFNTLGGIVVG